MGKASIIMVAGFAFVLSIILPKSYHNANSAYDNYIEYYNISHAHDIAVSAANIAADRFFWDNNWRAGYSDVPFSGGKYTVTLKDTNSNWVKIKSTGQYEKITQDVNIILQPGTFAQFAYYSKVEGNITWITGDTVWGRVHSQAILNVSGTPTFMGRVTTLRGTNPTRNNANFLGGYQQGVNIDLPTNLNSVLITAAAGGRVYSAGDLWITFSGNNVFWKTTATGIETTTPLNTFAPNGAISITNGNVHVQGTFGGRATIVATGGTGKGNIYIENDVLYQDNPLTNPTARNLLGLVAQNDIIVRDNIANGTNCTIEAALFSLNGGLTAENYNRNTSSTTGPPVLSTSVVP
jgi:hypothetical protein